MTTATTIHFSCPQCGVSLQAPPAKAGKTLPCPECKELLRIPDAPPEQRPQPEPPKSDDATLAMLDKIAASVERLNVMPGSTVAWSVLRFLTGLLIGTQLLGSLLMYVVALATDIRIGGQSTLIVGVFLLYWNAVTLPLPLYLFARAGDVLHRARSSSGGS